MMRRYETTLPDSTGFLLTLPGVGFRLGYVVVQTATDIGTMLSALPILGYFTVTQ